MQAAEDQPVSQIILGDWSPARSLTRRVRSMGPGYNHLKATPAVTTTQPSEFWWIRGEKCQHYALEVSFWPGSELLSALPAKLP